MAEAFEHKGHHVAIDTEGEEPKLTIGGRTKAARRVRGKLMLPELPYLEAESLEELARAAVEQLEEFETQE